jgi:predicted ATPase
VFRGRDRWYVITGPPCCGKSTTVELLAQRGFRVRSEVAREYVDQEILKGRTIQEIRSDMRSFQYEILRRALASEEALPKDELVFLDRGIPDSFAYFKLHRIPEKPYEGVLKSSKYRRIFYLEPLEKYEPDYARVESSSERDKLARLLWKVYSDLGFCIDRVPVLAREERIDYILGRVS